MDTPQENILEAQQFFRAVVDTDVARDKAYLGFPDMHHATAWAKSRDITSDVHYIPTSDKRLCSPVIVIYQY